MTMIRGTTGGTIPVLKMIAVTDLTVSLASMEPQCVTRTRQWRRKTRAQRRIITTAVLMTILREVLYRTVTRWPERRRKVDQTNAHIS